MSIIECKGLSKAYPVGISGRRTHRALINLDIQVEKKEVFGIVGPNGAGKSTILKILMGFIKSDRGTAFLANHPVESSNCRGIVGYLPENPCLYGHLSIADHLHFAAATAGLSRKETRKRLVEIVELVGMSSHIKSPIKSFSKGMTQRAALAYALYLKPEILILDEPMSGLDPLGRHLVVDIIKMYQQQGTTILFCSHILADVEHICTRIGIMDKGIMKAITTHEELLHMDHGPLTGATNLESFFLNTITIHNN